MVSAEKLADSETGDEKDILKTWEAWYRSMGYHRVAPFKRSGGLGEPYALYKAKNMTDPDVRREKLHKARPIAPGCKHPAAKVLGLVGRAWSFVVKQLKGDHFIVNPTQKWPQTTKKRLTLDFFCYCCSTVVRNAIVVELLLRDLIVVLLLVLTITTITRLNVKML